MDNFIEDLDLLYDNLKVEKNIKSNDFSLRMYVPIIIDFDKTIKNYNFIIMKMKFTKYLYIKNGARVYFSDADILKMLLQLKNKNTINLIIGNLGELLKGNGTKFYIYFDDLVYESIGLPMIEEDQILHNPKDIDIPFIDILTLLNMILAKDSASVPLWNNYEFMKRTIVKYIALLLYYYFHNKKAENYLTDIGYNFKKSIYSNYNTSQKTIDNDKRFYDFEKFENSGIL